MQANQGKTPIMNENMTENITELLPIQDEILENTGEL
jgi:hypothetical protein